jgi:hypothetical protein
MGAFESTRRAGKTHTHTHTHTHTQRERETETHVLVGEEGERLEDLLGELAQEREGHAVELGVPVWATTQTHARAHVFRRGGGGSMEHLAGCVRRRIHWFVDDGF